MRLVKYTHACVRLEKDGQILVIDPGELSEAEALEGADAVLVTHEHFDHLDVGKLRRSHAEVWAAPAVARKLAEAGLADRLHGVTDGDAFEAAGFTVRVHGEKHAIIHPDVPIVDNVGFVVEDEIFHPGDAFTVPDRSPGTLLVPAHAPWLKLAEAVEFVRTIAPRQAFPIHDGLLNDTGLTLVDRLLGMLAKTDYRRLAPGEGTELG
jgi:L-ascorbate metabolism protein UlaG (beta-lactamase superfamily)